MQSEIIDIYSEFYITRNIWLLSKLVINIKKKNFKYVSRLLELTEPKILETSEVTDNDIQYIISISTFKIKSIQDSDTLDQPIFKILYFNLVNRTSIRESFMILKYYIKQYKQIWQICCQIQDLSEVQTQYILNSKDLFHIGLKQKNIINRLNILFYCIYIKIGRAHV